MSIMESYKVNIQIPVDPIKYPGKFFKLRDIKKNPEIKNKIMEYFETFYYNVKINLDESTLNFQSTKIEVSFDHDNTEVITIRDKHKIKYMIETDEEYYIFDNYDGVGSFSFPTPDSVYDGIYFFTCQRIDKKITTSDGYKAVVGSLRLSADISQLSQYRKNETLSLYKNQKIVKPLMHKLFSKINLNETGTVHIIDNLDMMSLDRCKYLTQYFRHQNKFNNNESIIEINKKMLGEKSIVENFISKYELILGTITPSSTSGDGDKLYNYTLKYQDKDIYVIIKAPKFECLLRSDVQTSVSLGKYIPSGSDPEQFAPNIEETLFQSYGYFYNSFTSSGIASNLINLMPNHPVLTDLVNFQRGEILALKTDLDPFALHNYIALHQELKDKIIINIEIDEPSVKDIGISTSDLNHPTPFTYFKEKINRHSELNYVNFFNKMLEFYKYPTKDFIWSIYDDSGLKSDFSDSLKGTYIKDDMEADIIAPWFYPKIKRFYLDKNFKNY